MRAVKRTNSIGLYRSRERFHQISLKSAAESHFVFQDSARVQDAELLEASSCSCSHFMFNLSMFPSAENAPHRLRVQSIQQAVAGQIHQKRAPDFHDKYGNAVLASGSTFCVAVWVCMATQIEIEWNPSPVGRVTPKEWREQ